MAQVIKIKSTEVRQLIRLMPRKQIGLADSEIFIRDINDIVKIVSRPNGKPMIQFSA